MDSSTSQHSQQQPPSSSSQPSSASDSDYPSDNGYDGSAEGTSPERPSDNSSTTSMQWKTSTGDQPEDEDEDEDMINVNTIDSDRKGKQIDSMIASSSREGKPEEIGLLTDLYTLRNKTGRYWLSGENDQRDFYKFWIEEERDYASKKELDDKIGELHARFLKNMDKDVEGPTNAVDAEILRISHWIWGAEIESREDEEEDDDDDQEQDCKDLCGANAGDEGVNHGDDDVDGDDQEQDCKDLSDANAGDEGVNDDDDDQDETEDEVWGGDDRMDSTNGSDPMDKD